MEQRKGLSSSGIGGSASSSAYYRLNPLEVGKNRRFFYVCGNPCGVDVSDLTFRERDFVYRIPMELSRKTGFYFD
ncbi:hypothetical protein [Pajaroellobacter abortibovis]|uniref:hypothetical protein n=1 Tax=Pajaroellobacter abortibovis TaxID=1882918 RepID=UPI0009F93A2C|nr:hypothetical protein [Pajaroellobacter abortibovis]